MAALAAAPLPYQRHKGTKCGGWRKKPVAGHSAEAEAIGHLGTIPAAGGDLRLVVGGEKPIEAFSQHILHAPPLLRR